MSRRVLLRVDAGGAAGCGHLHRMHALAVALRGAGAQPVFVTRTAGLQRLLPAPPPPGPLAWNVWCAPVSATETGVLNWLRAQRVPTDVLVLDTPHPSEPQQLSALRQRCPVVRIDHPWAEPDTCDLLVLPGAHYAGDLLSALDAAWGDRLLVGWDYVLLRPEVAAAPRRKYGTGGCHRWPWVTFSAGGSDPERTLPVWLDLMLAAPALCPGRTRVFCLGQAARWDTRLPALTPDVWLTGYSLDYVQQAELLVCPFGVSVYEALALGTPCLTVGRTPADVAAARMLEAATDGAVCTLRTPLAQLQRRELYDALQALYHSRTRLVGMHHASFGCLDGQGAERVAQAIVALPEGP